MYVVLLMKMKKNFEQRMSDLRSTLDEVEKEELEEKND